MQEEPLVIDEAGQTTVAELEDAMLALAQAQAKKDADLMASLQERDKDQPKPIRPEPVKRVPLNRAQRRAQVKQYARLLTLTERQEPVVNPTIIPKAKRRRRPGQHGRLQHAV